MSIYKVYTMSSGVKFVLSLHTEDEVLEAYGDDPVKAEFLLGIIENAVEVTDSE